MTRHRHKTRFNPLSYPKTVRDRVEIDYNAKLSPKDQEWLASFNESESGGKPVCQKDITGKRVSAAEKRRLWRETKRYQRDMISSGTRMDIDVQVFIEGRTACFHDQNENALIEIMDTKEGIEMAKKLKENPLPPASIIHKPLLGESGLYCVRKYGMYDYRLYKLDMDTGNQIQVEIENDWRVIATAVQFHMSNDINKVK